MDLQLSSLLFLLFFLRWYKTHSFFFCPQVKSTREGLWIQSYFTKITSHQFGCQIAKLLNLILYFKHEEDWKMQLVISKIPEINISQGCLTLWIKIIAPYSIFCVVTTDKYWLFKSTLNLRCFILLLLQSMKWDSDVIYNVKFCEYIWNTHLFTRLWFKM